MGSLKFSDSLNQSHLNVRVNVAASSRINWKFHVHFAQTFSRDAVRTYGGRGAYEKIIECTPCESIFYIGIGYDEPNNGRDVFDLHCIWELDRIKKDNLSTYPLPQVAESPSPHAVSDNSSRPAPPDAPLVRPSEPDNPSTGAMNRVSSQFRRNP